MTTFLLLALLPIVLLSEPDGQPAPSPLRVTTFNIRYANPGDGPNAWTEREAFVIDVLRAQQADLLGLQEVLESQRVAITRALPEYTAIGVGREDGQSKGEYALLLVRSARFEVVRSGTIWLSETPDVVSKGWDARLERVATWAVLRDRADAGRELAVFNAHFDHVGVRARQESAKLLVARVEALGVPAVVMGDFNCNETDPPCLALGEKLLDTYRAVHPAPKEDEASYHDFKGRTAGRRIDFIYAGGYQTTDATIDRTSRDGRYPSDHFPVRAVITRDESPRIAPSTHPAAS